MRKSSRCCPSSVSRYFDSFCFSSKSSCCALKLTTAQYLTPSGRTVERRAPDGDVIDVEGGIEPDIFVETDLPDSLATLVVTRGYVSEFLDRQEAPTLSEPLPDSYIADFRRHVDVSYDLALDAVSDDVLARGIREQIALRVGGEPAALRERLPHDPQFVRALDALTREGTEVAAASP